MQYRALGRTGLQISEIGLGCASFWGMKRFDETTAVRLVHAAIDRGVTFFDTGPAYSGGNAEPRLGRALASHGKRKDLVIATKAGSRADQRGRRILALLWQIYSRRCFSLICLLQYGHRGFGGRRIRATMAWRTAGRLG